jgi:hypothetical protein
VAGLLGPTLVNLLREQWIARGYSRSHAYDATLYIMASLLVLGFFCNRAVRPLGAPPETSGTLAPVPPLASGSAESR